LPDLGGKDVADGPVGVPLGGSGVFAVGELLGCSVEDGIDWSCLVAECIVQRNALVGTFRDPLIFTRLDDVAGFAQALRGGLARNGTEQFLFGAELRAHVV
jgi:hypothetical protein